MAVLDLHVTHNVYTIAGGGTQTITIQPTGTQIWKVVGIAASIDDTNAGSYVDVQLYDGTNGLQIYKTIGDAGTGMPNLLYGGFAYTNGQSADAPNLTNEVTTGGGTANIQGNGFFISNSNYLVIRIGNAAAGNKTGKLHIQSIEIRA